MNADGKNARMRENTTRTAERRTAADVGRAVRIPRTSHAARFGGRHAGASESFEKQGKRALTLHQHCFSKDSDAVARPTFPGESRRSTPPDQVPKMKSFRIFGGMVKSSGPCRSEEQTNWPTPIAKRPNRSFHGMIPDTAALTWLVGVNTCGSCACSRSIPR